MSVCEFLEAETCKVASELAGMPVAAAPGNCQTCLASESPKSSNIATIGLARVALKKSGQSADHLYPEAMRDNLVDPDLAPDAMGQALIDELPWLRANQSDCDCFSHLRLLDRWGPDRAIAERSRIVGWFRGVARKLDIATSDAEIELAIFRAAESVRIRNRDAEAVTTWPFVWTYWASGAVGDELRYSIRSVLRHQPAARVIVVGDRPEWYDGEFIPKPRIAKTDFHAFRDCYSKLLMVAEQVPQFIWHMDDIYWIKPFAMREAAAPKYVRHVSQQRFAKWKPRSAWAKTRAHAYRWLLANGRPTYDFAAHLPQPIVSESFLAMERDLQLLTKRYRNWECCYLNTHHAAKAEDWGRRYLRVSRKRESIATRHKVLNHTHAQYKGAVEKFLAEQFPEPCRVEKQ